MKNKIILVFIGFFIFQVTTQSVFSTFSYMTGDVYEETGDESKNKEDLKQDIKITNIISSYKDKIFFSYHSSSPLYFQIKIIKATYQSVETPPPNSSHLFA